MNSDRLHMTAAVILASSCMGAKGSGVHKSGEIVDRAVALARVDDLGGQLAHATAINETLRAALADRNARLAEALAQISTT